MAGQFLIGVDIGTQGTKAALFSLNGKCLGTAFEGSKLHRPRSGVVEEDPERQVASVCRTIRACIRDSGVDAKSVAGIGIDGQMAGIIGVGDAGRNVTPYDSWLDTRCSRYIEKMQKRADDEIIRKAGGPASFNHGPKKLWWKHERPKVYKRIKAFVQPGGYAVMRLCGLDGKQAFIDRTYLHFSGFADSRKGQWDPGLCRTFGLSPSRLPAIVEPHAVVGEVTAAMARRCGVAAGTPVVAGCGDTAASFLACGATREGICVDVAGTASVFASTTQLFKSDTKHRVLSWGRSATPGLWHPYAYINGGGMNLEWFRTELGKLGREAPELEALNRLAARLELSPDDPIFVPHLGGRVSPSWPGIRGAWAGLTWSHSVAHLYRAILEGVALEYAVYRDALLGLGCAKRLTELRVTGGGEKSALWNQIKADALQTRVVQVSRSEGAPLGSALLAGYGVGVLKNLNRAASAWIRTGRAFKPVRKRSRVYEQRLVRYRSLLEALNRWATAN